MNDSQVARAIAAAGDMLVASPLTVEALRARMAGKATFQDPDTLEDRPARQTLYNAAAAVSAAEDECRIAGLDDLAVVLRNIRAELERCAICARRDLGDTFRRLAALTTAGEDFLRVASPVA